MDGHWVPPLYDAPFSRSFYLHMIRGACLLVEFESIQDDSSVKCQCLYWLAVWNPQNDDDVIRRTFGRRQMRLIVSTGEHKDTQRAGESCRNTHPQNHSSIIRTNSWRLVAYIGCCCQVISKSCFSVNRVLEQTEGFFVI